MLYINGILVFESNNSFCKATCMLGICLYYTLPGVSAHPGCIDEKCMLGYLSAYCCVMITCCRLFCAQAIVPSNGFIFSNCRSPTFNFCTSIPPEETIICKLLTISRLHPLHHSVLPRKCLKRLFLRQILQLRTNKPTFTCIHTFCDFYRGQNCKFINILYVKTSQNVNLKHFMTIKEIKI